MKFKVKKEKNGLPEMYRFYLSKFSSQKKEIFSVLSYKEYSQVIKDFNKELIRLIIDEGVEFNLGFQIGTVRIRKIRRKIKYDENGNVDMSSFPIDWPATFKLWDREYPGKTKDELKQIHNKPLVYYLNEHTDGCFFKLYWNKRGSNMINRSIYSIILTSVNNDRLGKILKSDEKPLYYE